MPRSARSKPWPAALRATRALSAVLGADGNESAVGDSAADGASSKATGPVSARVGSLAKITTWPVVRSSADHLCPSTTANTLPPLTAAPSGTLPPKLPISSKSPVARAICTRPSLLTRTSAAFASAIVLSVPLARSSRTSAPRSSSSSSSLPLASSAPPLAVGMAKLRRLGSVSGSARFA